jgi:hypothetical protein
LLQRASRSVAILERAIAAGHGEHHIAAIAEVMGAKGSPSVSNNATQDCCPMGQPLGVSHGTVVFFTNQLEGTPFGGHRKINLQIARASLRDSVVPGVAERTMSSAA